MRWAAPRPRPERRALAAWMSRRGRWRSAVCPQVADCTAFSHPGKNYDARWADPDDMSDMQSSIKKAKAALEGFLATVPAEQRGST